MRNKIIYSSLCLLIMVFNYACDPSLETRTVLENQTNYDVHFYLEKPDTILFWIIKQGGELQFNVEHSIGKVGYTHNCGYYQELDNHILIPELDSLILDYDSLDKAPDYYKVNIIQKNGIGGGIVECRKVLKNTDL